MEEHFYIAIALLFAYLNRRELPSGRAVWWFGIALLIFVLLLRCSTLVVVDERYKLRLFGTHVRIDGLLFGAMIAHARAFHREALSALVRRWRLALVAAIVGLPIPVFVLGLEHPFVMSLGLSFVYLAAGAGVVLAIHTQDRATSAPVRAVAAIGRYSYGIYLWHLPVRTYVIAPLQATGHWPTEGVVAALAYLAASVGFGVALTHAVELPILALRERVAPSNGPRAEWAAKRAP